MPQTITGTALSALAAVVIEIGAGAKASTFAGKQQTTCIAAPSLNLTNGFSQILKHLRANRVHHFRMVKFQQRYSVDKFQANAFHIAPLLCKFFVP